MPYARGALILYVYILYIYNNKRLNPSKNTPRSESKNHQRIEQ